MAIKSSGSKTKTRDGKSATAGGKGTLWAAWAVPTVMPGPRPELPEEWKLPLHKLTLGSVEITPPGASHVAVSPGGVIILSQRSRIYQAESPFLPYRFSVIQMITLSKAISLLGSSTSILDNWLVVMVAKSMATV